MKKVKIMLSAIALLAVVGGSLAFKAQYNYGTQLYTGTSTNSCPILKQNVTSTSDDSFPSTYVTVPTGNTTICELTYTKPNS